jgi:ribonuclease-3 family protein
MRDYFNIMLPDEELCGISNLGLAHVGDAVYELMVRAWLCTQGKSTSKGLHRAAVARVAAPAQAAAAEKIMPILTAEELTVYRRGRNTRVNSVPHNATRSEYHAATGLETLFGYLYLKGKTQRLNELFALIVEGDIYAS